MTFLILKINPLLFTNPVTDGEYQPKHNIVKGEYK